MVGELFLSKGLLGIWIQWGIQIFFKSSILPGQPLTEISDRDRQILVTVVNRWKRLSEELEKVVLLVTETD